MVRRGRRETENIIGDEDYGLRREGDENVKKEMLEKEKR
jgi:hypothetical protein